MYIPPLFKEDRIDVLHDGDPPHAGSRRWSR